LLTTGLVAGLAAGLDWATPSFCQPFAKAVALKWIDSSVSTQPIEEAAP
jgi:hypothetical protein